MTRRGRIAVAGTLVLLGFLGGVGRALYLSSLPPVRLVRSWGPVPAQGVGFVAVSRDGARALLRETDGGRLVVWELASWSLGREIAVKYPEDLIGAAFVGSRSVLLANNGGFAQGFRLFDLETRETMGLERYHREIRADCFAANEDGTRMVSFRQFGDVPVVWDLTTGLQIVQCARISSHEVRRQAVAISPSGREGLTSHEKRVVFWNLETGKSLRELEADGPVTCLAVSPDGRLALSGGVGGGVRLHDLATGKPLARLDHGKEQLRSVAFSPRATDDLVLTTTGEGVIRLWGRGREVARLTFGEKVRAHAAFVPPGDAILVSPAAGVLRLYEISR